MPTIQYPTLNVKNFTINPVYLSGDETSVNKYCADNGYTLSSFDIEKQRFSNHGGLLYQYYSSSDNEWKTEFGYNRIVTLLTYTNGPLP